jgi:hypothetical protein
VKVLAKGARRFLAMVVIHSTAITRELLDRHFFVFWFFSLKHFTGEARGFPRMAVEVLLHSSGNFQLPISFFLFFKAKVVQNSLFILFYLLF